MIVAHVGGMPVEETVVSLGPVLVVGAGVAWASLRGRLSAGLDRRRARRE